jgi:phage N-6-adenine-methyltransferase
MNPNVMFSSKSEIWETPIDFFEELDREFHFQTDVCALPENKKCAHYYSPEQDGLKQKWEGVCWCNPPYGRNIGKWVKKAAESEGTVVCLLPARTDTKWFHEYINGKAEIRFVKGRLKFGGSKNSAPFPSMIVIFRQGEKEDGRVIYQNSQ